MNDQMDSGEFSNSEIEDTQDGSKDVDNDNKYNSHFDAGVDADEAEDPRTYIQQLTGKLSQSLRKYNRERNKVDVDLCKYVAGMINKQASEGLSEKDIEEIVDKIEPGRDTYDGVDDNSDEMDTENNNIINKKDDNGNDMNTESISRDEEIEEVFNDIMNTKNSEQHLNNSGNNSSFKKKPFMPPSFK